MNNANIISSIDGIENKLVTLLKEHDYLKKELQSSMQENKELRIELSGRNEELKNFQNQFKISKIVTSIAEGTQNNAELKHKLNEYIKEIDKCIAHLSE